MDISQAKKLSQDKIEADFLTRIVRRNIKRKELEKQKAREAFREAFEVLLESQDERSKTQNLMLDELQRLNAKIDEGRYYDGDRVDDDYFFDARDYVDLPRRRRRRRPINQQDLDDIRDEQEEYGNNNNYKIYSNNY